MYSQFLVEGTRCRERWGAQLKCQAAILRGVGKDWEVCEIELDRLAQPVGVRPLALARRGINVTWALLCDETTYQPITLKAA